MLSAPFFDASGNKNIGAIIRISREIWCPPYAGFLAILSTVIVLENVYVAQMIVKGFLIFFIFKTTSFVLNFFKPTADQG